MLWMKPATALEICGPNVWSSEPILGSPLLVSWLAVWLTVAVMLRRLVSW